MPVVVLQYVKIVVGYKCHKFATSAIYAKESNNFVTHRKYFEILPGWEKCIKSTDYNFIVSFIWTALNLFKKKSKTKPRIKCCKNCQPAALFSLSVSFPSVTRLKSGTKMKTKYNTFFMYANG